MIGKIKYYTGDNKKAVFKYDLIEFKGVYVCVDTKNIKKNNQTNLSKTA